MTAQPDSRNLAHVDFGGSDELHRAAPDLPETPAPSTVPAGGAA
ncbi:hypothetical protein [Nocardia terrae]|nr:hypothetical protein [Nocardia terrae]